MNFYPYILGIMDTLNEWNEKLNDFAANHMDNVGTGTLILGAIFIISFWGIKELNKKQ